MALADTARLVASLELQDKFTGPARKAEGSIGSLDKKMGTLGQSGQRLGAGLGRAFSTIAKVGVGAAVGGIALLTVNIKAGIDALNELEAQEVATATVIESTNGVAGISAKAVRELAEEYEALNATIDDKVIQNAENMLLTFTNVREDAFEPALEAALNLNEAMGGGPESLQAIVIKVGKALNDPTKGLAALSKAGVLFTDQQKEQIKALQESGDLLGAQKIILDELGTEFGGRFAAAGQTAEGRMAKLGDTIEDLQKNLAGPLLPAIDRVREKLITILSTDRAQQAAKKIGEAIAGIFDQPNVDRAGSFIGDLLDKFNNADFKEGLGTATANISSVASSVAGLPWESIKDAAKLLGTGSKALLDAFLGLPPWVQTAVLTGWGLNKLTGGALTGIVGALTSGLIKGILGINAGVVNINAATVNGPSGGVPGGAGGGLGLVGSTLLTAGALATIAGGISAILAGGSGDPAKQTSAALDISGGFPGLIGRAVTDALVASGLIPDPTKPAPVTDETAGQTLGEVDAGIAAVDKKLEEANHSHVTNRQAVVAALNGEKAELVRTRAGIVEKQQRVLTATLATSDRIRSGFNDNGGKLVRLHAGVNGVRDNVRTSNSHLNTIKNKKTTVNVTANISNQVNVSAANVQNAVQAYTYTTGGRAYVL